MSTIRPEAADSPAPPAPGIPRAVVVLGGGLLALAALVLLFGYAALLVVPVYTNAQNSDFAAPYYPAAQLLLAGGDPYTVATYIYMQPPALLWIVAPLTALPPETARAVWLGVQILLVSSGILALLRAFDFRLTALRLGFILIVFLSPNLIWGVLLGQSVVLMFLLEALGFWLLRRNRPMLGGLAVGALVLKPHLLAVVLPALLIAPRRAWVAAAASIAALLLAPELLGVHLLGSFIQKLLAVVGAERYNKLNLADMFANLVGDSALLHALGWVVLGLCGVVYAWLLWRIWRAESAPGSGPAPTGAAWHLTPLVQLAMVAAYLWLPYTLAYDLILVAGTYLWRFQANGYRLDRPLTWNLGLLWLLPILTLALHAAGIGTTLNPLLILGLALLLWRPAFAP